MDHSEGRRARVVSHFTARGFPSSFSTKSFVNEISEAERAFQGEHCPARWIDGAAAHITESSDSHCVSPLMAVPLSAETPKISPHARIFPRLCASPSRFQFAQRSVLSLAAEGVPELVKDTRVKCSRASRQERWLAVFAPRPLHARCGCSSHHAGHRDSLRVFTRWVWDFASPREYFDRSLPSLVLHGTVFKHSSSVSHQFFWRRE